MKDDQFNALIEHRIITYEYWFVVTKEPEATRVRASHIYMIKVIPELSDEPKGDVFRVQYTGEETHEREAKSRLYDMLMESIAHHTIKKHLRL